MLMKDIISPNLMNFLLNYLEDKLLCTTNLKMRMLGYTRILFLPLEFYY